MGIRRYTRIQSIIARTYSPYVHPYIIRRISTPVATSPRCRLQGHLQLFSQWLSLKCKSLVTGDVASAIPVSAVVFYSPVLDRPLQRYFQTMTN